MAQNLCRAFSTIKSTISSNSCLKILCMRNFQSFLATSKNFNNFKYLNFINRKENIFKIKRTITLSSFRTCDKININTNVVNNVLLYKCESFKQFRYLNILGAFQVCLFIGVSWVIKDLIPKRLKDEPLFIYLNRSKLIIGIVILPIIAAIVTPLVIYAFTVRSVKYIILNKGGKNITIVTHHPIKKSIQITVPLEEVSVKKSRKELNRYMSVKLAPKPFYYVMHKDGTFINPDLYDVTVASIKTP